MSNVTFNSTDDNTLSGTIYIDDVAWTIPGTSTVIAFVQDTNSKEKIISDITILSTDTNNDWDNGVIEGVFSDSDSEALASYDQKLVLVCVRITTQGHTETFTETVKARKLLD